MSKYRFITPNRAGKWYAELHLAKRFANVIGAEFLDGRSGEFVVYPGTKLEVATQAEALESADIGMIAARS